MAHVSSGTLCKCIMITVQVTTRHVPNRKLVRSQVIFANTMFHSVCYRPDECQIITAGTDRKVRKDKYRMITDY